jgi:hypothetical protein
LRSSSPAGTRIPVAYLPGLVMRRASELERGQLVRLAKRHAPRMGERLVDELLGALAGEKVTVPAEQTARRVIAELATELDRLADHRDQLEREIETLFRSHP